MVGKYLCPSCGEEIQGPVEKGSLCPTCKIMEERGPVSMLTDPAVIVHRPDHLCGSYEVLILDLTMKPGAFGILLADLVRHGARALECSESEILRWIQKEMKNQTGKDKFSGRRIMPTEGSA